MNVELRNEHSDVGGTMRPVGKHAIWLADFSEESCMEKDVIVERHRHRYEVNNNLLPAIEKMGLKV